MTGQLPPERAMPRDVKARVRQDLLSRLSDPAGRPRSPWTATGLAAAAVVAIVGVVAGGTWLADRGGPDEAAPQSSPTSSTPPAETTSPSPTDTPLPRRDTCATSITRTDGGLGSPGDPVTHWYDTSFATGLRTSIYVDGDSWQVCDTFAAADGGDPTLLAVNTGRTVPTKEQLAISTNFVPAGSGLQAQYVAAGLVAPSVTGIRYSFPDGTDVPAELADGAWWMNYLPSSGPLAQGDLRGLGPITVTVTAGGVDHTYELEWGSDTCAQVNHGC